MQWFGQRRDAMPFDYPHDNHRGKIPPGNVKAERGIVTARPRKILRRDDKTRRKTKKNDGDSYSPPLSRLFAALTDLIVQFVYFLSAAIVANKLGLFSLITDWQKIHQLPLKFFAARPLMKTICFLNCFPTR